MLDTLIQASSQWYTITFNPSFMECRTIVLKHNHIDMRKEYNIIEIIPINLRHVIFKTDKQYIVNVEYMNMKLYVNIKDSHVNQRYVFDIVQTEPYNAMYMF